eukprot:PhM_4_TR10271/c0_g1_i1/m.97189/K10410/DNALI; dynein light intermediate chain, axonemal
MTSLVTALENLPASKVTRNDYTSSLTLLQRTSVDGNVLQPQRDATLSEYTSPRAASPRVNYAPYPEEDPIANTSRSPLTGTVTLRIERNKDVLDVREALDSVFPYVDIDGEAFHVSEQPALSFDIINLHEALESRCKQRNARPVGVCPVREELYEDAFDEIIRQTIVSCPERGVLLAKIRDEISHTISSYRVLFQSANELSMRKAIESELMLTMMKEKDELHRDVAIAENRVKEMKAKLHNIEKRIQERRDATAKNHAEEVAFIKKGNQQLTNEIKRLTN